MAADQGTSADLNSTPDSSTSEESVLIKSLDFSSPWHFSDVVLVVGDTKLHVHKCILSMWSPVFQKMFSSSFVEGNAKEIPLPGKSADEIEVLLQLIYPSGTKQEVTEENYEFLVQLADEYQMDRLKTLCSEFLVDHIDEDLADCLDFFTIAERFGLEDVTEKCYQEVRYKSSADLEGSESFNGCDPKVKIDICMRIIKELEKTLQEYVTTCSSLVREVYKQVYEKFYSNNNVSGSNVYGKITRAVPVQSAFSFSIPKTQTASFPQVIPTGIPVIPVDNPKEHIQKHRDLKTRLKLSQAEAEVTGESVTPKNFNTKPFEFSCCYCIERVQAIRWNDTSDSYSILKKPLDKLYALQKNNKVANIIANTPVNNKSS